MQPVFIEKNAVKYAVRYAGLGKFRACVNGEKIIIKDTGRGRVRRAYGSRGTFEQVTAGWPDDVREKARGILLARLMDCDANKMPEESHYDRMRAAESLEGKGNKCL